MQKKILDVIEVQNGVILPAKYMSPVFPCGLGGVVDEEGEFIEESSVDLPGRFGGLYDYTVFDESSLEEDVIYIGHLRTHWGHFLVDCTLRMWYLSGKDIHCKVAYCGSLYEENALPENIIMFFSFLGIKRDQLLDIRVPTRVSRIFIPQMPMNSNNMYTYKFRDMFREISGKIHTDLYETCEKLYYTRTGLGNKKEIGEKLIEKIFRKNGYRVVSPERESLGQQIAFMKSCKTFVSIEGTVAHNIVFAGEHTKQIILKKHTYMNARQPYLNECMNVNAKYINIGYRPFGKHFPPDFYDGIFLLRATKELKIYCQENNMWFPTYREILFTDIKSVIKYLYQCGIYIKKYLKTKHQTGREDRMILKRINKYKNIVIYGMNERAFRWERKIRKKGYLFSVFMTDTNWKPIQKYEKVYNWEKYISLENCCFLISLGSAESSFEVKNTLIQRGVNEENIYCYSTIYNNE